MNDWPGVVVWVFFSSVVMFCFLVRNVRNVLLQELRLAGPC